MKRFLLLTGVFVLVVAAVGVGIAPASTPREKAIVAARKHAATLTARELIHEFVAPPHATRINGWPPDYGFHSKNPNTAPLGEFVDLHRFWVSHGSLASVVAFENAHGPAGFHSSGSAANGDGSETQLSFDWPARGVTTRRLVVTISRRQTRTIIRADAQIVWVYPRSPQEKVPAGVSEIDVKAPKVFRRVSDPAQVQQIVRWFDRLPISPPGVVIMCPLMLLDKITLVFRSADGKRVASAQVPGGRAGVCDSIAFSIHHESQKPLVDPARGTSFVRRLQDLLDVKLETKR